MCSHTIKIVLISIYILGSLSSYSQNNRRILFIGIDGCRTDALKEANTPAIDNLLTKAKYSMDGLCAYKTWSGNGWSSMLTGVWHIKHGVTDNTFAGSNFIEYPDFISRIETFDSTPKTMSIVHWDPINSTIINNADIETTYDTDAGVKNGAVDALTNEDPDVLFVAFDDVDHAGHTYGFSPSIPEYIDAIETTDTYVASILFALENRPDYDNEGWLVVVTTDHGGTLAGHGGGTLDERTIFTIYSQLSFDPEETPRKILSQSVTSNEVTFPSGTYAMPSDQPMYLFGSTQDFTIEFWVKANAYVEDPSFISNKDWNNGYNPGFVISAQKGEFWKVNIGDGTDRVDIEGGFIQPDDWHHLAVSFDRDGLMTAYEDGVVVGFEHIENIGDINSGLPMVINQDGTTTYDYNFDGSYKDIRVWDAVIPGDVIVQWANQSVLLDHPYYDHLLANWRCDEGVGNTLLDTGPGHSSALVEGTLNWNLNKTDTFIVYDYSATPREPDNAVTVLEWMCVPINDEWNLDGQSWVSYCLADATKDLDPKNEMKAFPNPVSDEIQIDFVGDYAVYDLVGHIVKKGKLQSGENRIKLDDVMNGFYVIHFPLRNEFVRILKI